MEEIGKSSDPSSKPPASKQAEVVKSRVASAPVETKSSKSLKPETLAVCHRPYVTKEEIPLQFIEAGPMKSNIENKETLTHHCFFKILMPELKVLVGLPNKKVQPAFAIVDLSTPHSYVTQSFVKKYKEYGVEMGTS